MQVGLPCRWGVGLQDQPVSVHCEGCLLDGSVLTSSSIHRVQCGVELASLAARTAPGEHTQERPGWVWLTYHHSNQTTCLQLRP